MLWKLVLHRHTMGYDGTNTALDGFHSLVQRLGTAELECSDGNRCIGRFEERRCMRRRTDLLSSVRGVSCGTPRSAASVAPMVECPSSDGRQVLRYPRSGRALVGTRRNAAIGSAMTT